MLSIVSELEEILKSKNIQSNQEKKYNNLTNINDRYNKLIRDGYIKKRGYTLRGIEDTHLINIKFNS